MSTIDERVQAASAALIRGEDANWELARLTWESTRTGKGRPQHRDDTLTMEEWCGRIRATSGRKFSLGTGSMYKQVWSTHRVIHYPDSELPDWSEAFESTQRAPVGERFADSDARRALSNIEHVKPEIKRELLNQLVQDGGPELKRDLTVYLAEDPDVRDHWQTRATVDRAIRAGDERQERRMSDLDRNDVVLRPAGELNAGLDLSGIVGKLIRELNGYCETIEDTLSRRPNRQAANFAMLSLTLPDLDRTMDRFTEDVRRIKAFVETGESDLDTFVDGVLKGVDRG